TIDQFGRVGVGTTTPGGSFEVNGHGDTALTITNGAIRVTGAGVGTNTAAFILVKTAANTCGGGSGLQIGIDNPFSNDDPNAILIITPRRVAGSPSQVKSRIEAVYVPFEAAPPDCPKLFNKWSIITWDGSPVGSQYNVLVIKP